MAELEAAESRARREHRAEFAQRRFAGAECREVVLVQHGILRGNAHRAGSQVAPASVVRVNQVDPWRERAFRKFGVAVSAAHSLRVKVR